MTHDPIDLDQQDQDRRQQRERDKLAARTTAEDIKWLMKSRQGRRVVWRLLEDTGIYRSSYTGNSETYFREGMRNIGLIWLTRITEICPGQFALMMQEQTNERSNPASSEPTS